MLSVEAAGNNEPLSRAPGLQAHRGAQDFRQCNIKADALMTFVSKERTVSLMMAESPKRIASLSSTAAGLLQPFITSFASSVSHKRLP